MQTDKENTFSPVLLRHANERQLTDLSTKLKGIGAGRVKSILALIRKNPRFSVEDLARDTRIPVDQWLAWEEEGWIMLPKTATVDIDAWEEDQSHRRQQLEASIRADVEKEYKQAMENLIQSGECAVRETTSELQRLQALVAEKDRQLAEAKQHSPKRLHTPSERGFSMQLYHSPQVELRGEPKELSPRGAFGGIPQQTRRLSPNHDRIRTSTPDDMPPILTPQVIRSGGRNEGRPKPQAEMDNTLLGRLGKALPPDGVFGNAEPKLGNYVPHAKSKGVQTRQSVFGLKNGTSVQVHCGNLAFMELDAIVNAANGQLQHEGGLANAISRAAGPGFQEGSDNIRAAVGTLAVTDAVPQSAPLLPCTYVIHSVGPQYAHFDDDASCKRVLTQTIRKALQCASLDCGVKTIGLPLISSGIYGVPLDLAVAALIDALNLYGNETTRLIKEIHIFQFLNTKQKNLVIKKRVLLTKLSFRIKKSRYSEKSRYKELNCADRALSFY